MIGIILAVILAVFGFLADNVFLGLISIALAIMVLRVAVINMNRTYTMICFGVLFVAITSVVLVSSDSDDEEKLEPQNTQITPPRTPKVPPRTTYKPTQTNKTQKIPVIKSTPHTRPVVRQKK